MREILLTQEKVALVDDEDYELISKYTWCAIRRVTKNSVRFYACTNIRENGKNKSILMHRLLKDPGIFIVDHEDGNGLNNQKCNLRKASYNQNNRNQTLRKRTNQIQAKFKGIVFHQNKWYARITINSNKVWLGGFATQEEAARVYDNAAIRYHGEFAKTNEMLGLYDSAALVDTFE